MKATFPALCLLCVRLAHADILDRTGYFDISAQALNTALVEFAKQARVQISADSELLRRYQAPGVKGTESARSVLTKLLAETGLGYRVVQDTVQIQRMSQAGGADFATGRAPIAPQVSTSPVTHGAASVIDEVIVTSQKRPERLQEVPISISAISGQLLDTVTARGLLEVLNRTPGVAVYGSDRPLIAVRGVSAGGVTVSAGSNPIAYYLDTVPFGLVRTALVPDLDTYDLERVEVLRGPQGTLYGANAQNGVIRILTKQANLQELELKTRAAFSSTEHGGENFRGDTAVNVPLVTGKLALRGAASYQALSGWIDKPHEKDANDAAIRMARFTLGAQPIERLSLDMSTWISRSDSGAPANSNDARVSLSAIDEPISDDYAIYGLKLAYHFAAITLTSNSGYLEYAHRDVRDRSPGLLGTLPVIRSATSLDAHTFSQEVVLTADEGSAWRGTLGGMYRDSRDRLRQNHSAGGTPFDYGQGSESYAVFGEIERRILDDKLGFRMGLRYFHDDTFIEENISPPGTSRIHASASFGATTHRMVLTWYPSREVTLYGSWSEGFRSGFPQNPSVARSLPSLPPLEPDVLRNYEVGLKTLLWDGHLSLESAAFYIDWRNTQQALSIASTATVVAAQLNSKSASGAGFELSLAAAPTERLGLDASFGWNDLTFDEDVVSGGRVLFPGGARLNGSPEYIAGVAADYRFPLGERGLRARLSASANYISRRLDRLLLGDAVLVAESDSLLVTRTAFAVDAHRWSATLFVDNLNDESGASIVSVLNPTYGATRVRPRTLGLQVEFHL